MSEENVGSVPAPQAEVVNSSENSDEALEASPESQENVESAENPEASKEQKQLEKKIKKLKLKVDGEEFEEEVDLDNDEYLVRQLQLAKMAQKRAQAYSQLEKEVTDFINQLRSNPKKALASDIVGLDIKKLAAEIIEEEIERSQKSPEVLEKERLEEELKQLKAERERENEERRKRELAERQQKEFERYDMLFEKALKGTDLPKTPYFVKRMADWMLLGLENGIELEPQEVANLVRDELQQDLNQMFELMPEEVIEKFIGEKNFERVRKKKLAAAKSKKLESKPIIQEQKDEQKQEVKKIKMKDFFGNF
jgi:hypothetical protein